MTTLNETSGVITSPFYPRNYPDNQECRWQITASKGNHVVMIIEEMSTPYCGRLCSCDYLEVQNGFSSNGAIGGRICSSSIVRYYSMFESLTVLFVSDGGYSKQYRGFKATYLQANHSSLIPGEYKKWGKGRNCNYYCKVFIDDNFLVLFMCASSASPYCC